LKQTPSAQNSADRRPVVLLFFRYFSRQFEATGPTQSLRRMIEALSGRFRFRVVTIAPPGEPEMQWGEEFGHERIAVAKGLRGVVQQWRLMRSTRFDLALHNSFFDPQMTIAVLVLRKLRLIPRRPTIVAPRGELNPGALALKSPRKRAYLASARFLGLLDEVHLQATDDREKATTKQKLPHARSILTAPNLRLIEPLPRHVPREPAEPLRIAFLSRVDPMKNLDLALDLLAQSGASVRFDIIGPTFNPAYWARCRKLIEAMPANVPVRYLETVPPEQVVETLAGYDLMLLPTAGENYGHAIVDSLFAGTPVLVSDRTPWRGLATARAGADLPLEDRPAWIDWIRRFSTMGEAELLQWRAGARAYVEQAFSNDVDRAKVEQCLATAMEKRP
jgi:glycosyltransferase involved in cell wall biosynthesis